MGPNQPVISGVTSVSGTATALHLFTHRAGCDTAPQVVLDPHAQDVASSAGITVLGYSPLLSGAYTRTDRDVPAEYDTPQTTERLSVLQSVAEETGGLDAGQIVLAWMSQRRAPVLPIVGVSHPDQIRSAWQAISHPLSAQSLTRLDSSRS